MKRTLAELGIAGLLTAIGSALRLLDGDFLRPALLTLPLVITGLRALERHARAHGGRRIAPLIQRIHGWTLLLLVALALGRQALGLPAMDRVLVAGLLLLLAHHVARLLMAFRPCLGQCLPRRPPWLFFALPLLVYLALMPWSMSQRQVDGDEPYYLLLTHSLAYDLDSDLANNYGQGDWRRFMERTIEPQPGDPKGPGGEQYSRHNALLPLLLAPGYRLAGRAGALATLALLCAALAWMVLRLAASYTPHQPGAALLAYALFAFSPPLLLYSQQIWIEVPAALLLCLALDRLHALQSGRGQLSATTEAAPHHTRLIQMLRDREMWLLALPLALMPWLKLRLGMVAASLLVLALIRAGRRAWPLAAIVAGAGGSLLLFYRFRFGNPLKMHTLGELELLSYPPAHYLRGALGMLFDPAFGLLGCAPIWLLLLPACVCLWRQQRDMLADFALISLPYLALLIPRSEWYGGWSPPFRYALVFLPLGALALVPLLAERHRGGLRALGAALGALTLILAVSYSVVPGWTYDLADGRTHLLDAASQRLGGDTARLFPSFVRPRSASWIWPLAALLALPLAAYRGSGRERARATHWGLVSLLAATALIPTMTHRVPTRVIEPEDAYLERRNGKLHPDPWTVHRTRFNGGWMLYNRGRLSAPVVPGGDQVTLRFALSFIDNLPIPFNLHIAAGDHPLAIWPVVREPGWQSVELGPFDWPAGAPLVLEIPDPTVEGRGNGLIVDRVELRWQ